MANIEVAKSNGQPAARRVDAFDAMRDEMNRLFERFEHGWPRLPSLFGGARSDVMMPDIDVKESQNAVTVSADLPGLTEKDVSVTFTNGLLTIKGERKSEREEKKENYYLAERSFGSFERVLRLPDTIDEGKIEARFENGVLHVVASKRPEAVKAEKKIEIKKA
jgi:HSP20 family protein